MKINEAPGAVAIRQWMMQERAVVTRARILRAAAELFDAKGFIGASIGDVVASSGHTSGAVYFHFRSKDNLAVSVVEAYHSRWTGMVDWYLECDAPAPVRLVALSLGVGRAYRDDPVVRAGARLWFERAAIAPAMPAPFVQWIAVTELLLRQGLENKDFLARVDVTRTARVLVSAFFGTHTVTDSLGERLRLEERVIDLWLTMLPALTAEEPEQVLASARVLDASCDRDPVAPAPAG